MTFFKDILIVTVLAATAACPGAFAIEEGGGSSGGGDSFSASISQILKRTNQAFNMICTVKGAAADDLCKFQRPFEVVATSPKIVPQAKILGSNKEERDAGNDGKGTIYVSTERFKKAILESEGETRIVHTLAHEALVLAGAEMNDQYSKSTELMFAFKSNYIDIRALATPLVSPEAKTLQLKPAPQTVTPPGLAPAKLPVCSSLIDNTHAYAYRGSDLISSFLIGYTSNEHETARKAAVATVDRMVANGECTYLDTMPPGMQKLIDKLSNFKK